MKNCPFCKANIEDNARFCLYCMKSLNEKEVIHPKKRRKPWWIWAVAGVFLAVILIAAWQISEKSPEPPEKSTGDLVSADTDSTAGSSNLPDEDNIREQEEQQTKPQATNPASEPKENIGSSNPVTTPPVFPEETAGEPTQDITEPPTQDTTETPEQIPSSQPVYTYRLARAGDDFYAMYSNPGTDIVITGVARASDNGVYDIPSYIEGGKVIAIASNAFSGTNARAVYVPETVRNIWNYAFYGCDLTDIYFRGNAVYTESKAFSGRLIIHCTVSCSDRSFRYYKDCAESYGAVWEEWNG